MHLRLRGPSLRRFPACPVPLTVRGTQALVSFAPLAFKLFFAARQNAVLRRSPLPSREELLQRHKETTAVVERGMTVTSALLGAASGLPLVGPLCQVVKGILGDVEEFREKADDVLVLSLIHI